MVIGAAFELDGEFRRGLAQVVVGGKITYIDKAGRIVLRTGREDVSF